MPSAGDIVKTPNCEECKVQSVNYLTKKVKVENDGKIEEFENDKVKILKSNKQNKEKKTKEEIELEKEVE